MHSNRGPHNGCLGNTALRPDNFETRERGEERKWHNRIDLQESRIPTRFDITAQTPDARLAVWNAKDANMTFHPLNRSMSVPSNVHVPYCFDPVDQTLDAVHTAPFFTSQIRKSLNPTQSSPNAFPRMEGRLHCQGKMDIAMHPTWHTAIPGYTGHCRGKVAENVYGGCYMLENEKAQVRVQNRRPPSPTNFRQSTIKEPVNAPMLWKKSAKHRWKQCSSGMTHQPGAPFGPGDTYRQNLAEKEHRERMALKAEYDHATTTIKTWTANQPQHIRDHNLWRTGICGYRGYYPRWKQDQDFFEKREVGKVHPPYCPKVTAYSCFLQPPETPIPQRPEK
eukprot:GEMP01051609.1.p1 GENE.GEMP01051609.1~~GEMP01051609.1.p1  ORF type:complete len:336 (+),score=47.88 GEMP01051609.1:135-1142(+)